MPNIFAEIKNILTAPLGQKLDAVQLFLIVGLVLIFIAGWLIILRYMEAGISSIAEEV